VHTVRAHVTDAQAWEEMSVLRRAIEAAGAEGEKGEMSNRCYLRGTSLLGIFNTIIGCLFNRVLVVAKDTDTGKVVRRYWDRAGAHPPAREEET